MGTDLFLPMYFQGLYPANEFHKIDLWSRDFYTDALDFYSKKTGENGKQMLIKGIAYLSAKINLIEDLYDVLKVWDSASSKIFVHEVFNKESPNLITEFRNEVQAILNNRKEYLIERHEKELRRLREKSKNDKIIIDSLIKYTKSNDEIKKEDVIELKTFTGSTYSKDQLNTIRVRLIDRKIIDRISEADFLYLFSGQPIFKLMNTIKWKKKRPLGHSFLKIVVYNEHEFDFNQVNACIKCQDGKLFDSNNKSTSQFRNDDILKIILQF